MCKRLFSPKGLFLERFVNITRCGWVTVYKSDTADDTINRQSSCIVIVPSQPGNHVRLRVTVSAYSVCAFELFAQLQNHLLP